jgi:hypothetical protein
VAELYLGGIGRLGESASNDEAAGA